MADSDLAFDAPPAHPAFSPDDRTTFLGGSDIARVMGLAPQQWGTAVDLYFDKVEGKQAPDPKREALFKRGKRLEPYAVQILVEDYGVEVVARNQRYQDAEVPYFSSEIDFEWQAPDGSVQNGEIKTVSVFATDAWGEADTGDIPIEYACQAQWNLGVTGRKLCQVGALFGADNMVRYWVERDDDVIAAMRERGREFWERYVLRREPPPPRTLTDAYRLWPREKDKKAIEATPEIAAAWTTLKMIRQRAASFDEAKDSTEFLIAEHMKDANTLTFEGLNLCTYKEQSRDSIDGEALAASITDLRNFCLLTAQAKQALDMATVMERLDNILPSCTRTSNFRVMRTAQNRKG